MPNWKLVITSGSDAALNSLNVKTYVSASSFNGSFTGSLEGTASQAISSSYALTASYALNAGASSGFPFSGSAQITGSLGVTGSFSVNGNTGQTVFASDADTLVISGSLIITGSASITGSLKVSGSITGSLFGTASWAQNAVTASYALFAANGGGGGISAIYIQDEGITQGTASYFNFYGAGVTATVSDSTASINIPGGGGGTTNNASNAVLNQSSPAVTWSFSHNLGAKYPVFTVFDSNDNVIIPQQIKAVDTASALIYFSTARTGTAVASVAGNVLTSSYSISSSYAYTASSAVSASFAFTASSANSFNVRNSLTASGLRYPTADGTYASQVIQTDASGNLSFGDVQTTFDNVYNGEATTLVKGTPVYISGSNGANPKVFRADAADANKMPVTYIVSENISAGNVGRGITLGHIEGIDLTGYPAGTSVYVNSGGGWTSTRPTGSNVTIQFLGLVTKEGSGGKGLVLNPGPVVLPNIQSGYTWVGNGNSYPIAVTTSSLLVTSASYAATSSYATNFTASNILVTGTITAQTLVVSTISSSVAYSSGSNIFGNSTANTQTMTGSLNVSGSTTIIGRVTILDHTGSLFGTSSWAQTASTASYVLNAVSSSYAYTASSATNASASLTAISASYAATASYLLGYISPFPFTGSAQITGSLGVTGSVSATSFSGSFSGSGANLFGIPATGITGLNLSQISSGSVSASISPNQGLLINTSVSASNFTGSFTGSLAGIATSASYASFALTASYSLGGSGFPFSGSAVITGSFLVSQSFVDFSKSTGVSGSFTGSLYGTASYATFALSCSFAPGFTTNMSQSAAATTWSFTHNLNTINPIVQVYDLTNSQIIPNQIVGMNNSTAEIRFDYAQAGYAVASNGGGLYVTGSTSTLVQTVGAVTWSFTHNLNNKYNTYEVYDSNDTVIIPSGIKALTNNAAEIYFAGPQTGRVVGSFSGINGSPNAATASYALTATSASYAATASYLNPITNSYVVLTQVSQSLNFVDDVAAAAGGVPLGGIYRNGNFILIRLS